MTVIDDVVKQFNKNEVVNVAREIGLEIDPGERSVVIIEKTIREMRRQAATMDIDLSDLAYEFAQTAEIIDDDGNLLKEKEVKQGGDLGEIPIEYKQPECFKYAAANDKMPECKRCKIFKWCAKKRLDNRPPCFGTKVFNPNEPECQGCLEYVEGFCKGA